MGNPSKAQGRKAEKRTASERAKAARRVTTQIAKTMMLAADAGYSLKVELGVAQPTTSSVTSFEEWKRNRAG